MQENGYHAFSVGRTSLAYDKHKIQRNECSDLQQSLNPSNFLTEFFKRLCPSSASPVWNEKVPISTIMSNSFQCTSNWWVLTQVSPRRLELEGEYDGLFLSFITTSPSFSWVPLPPPLYWEMEKGRGNQYTCDCTTSFLYWQVLQEGCLIGCFCECFWSILKDFPHSMISRHGMSSQI